MRVLLTGATGFVGGEICEHLLQAGHEVRAVARNPDRKPQRNGLQWIAGDFARDHDARAWVSRLEGIDAIVNAVGIIREKGSSTFDAVHSKAPRALFDAAAAAGIRRVVQVSAMGVDAPGAELPYQTSKLEADRHLESLDVDAVILRPSLIHGERGESAILFRMLAALPVVPVVGGGDFGFRPIHVADLARAVGIAIAAETPIVGSYDVGGHQRVTLKQMLLAIRAWLGERPTGPCLSIPLPLMRPAAWLGDLTGLGPLDSAMLAMLQQGADADVSEFERAFGFEATGMLDHLGHAPASDAIRTAARFEPWRLPIRWLVASIWLITPIVTLAQWDLGIELLAAAGFDGPMAPVLLVGSCVLELVMAGGLFIGRGVRLIGWAQIALMVFYSAVLSVTQPELWMDPFGPLSKNLPLIAATLAMIALERPRRAT